MNTDSFFDSSNGAFAELYLRLSVFIRGKSILSPNP